ncbi:glucosyl-3-phosphoglycerate synthase [Spongiactinospora gelatinilytica]|uniref:Glucosyl-3-phosphoglycerate synthase n=1 Tax=Spongiactinospora gelatinilytica TaxID=2666298 RepID=A0A2W2GR37_9ACTN|nr:glucosyl-3-phosphoglycerate synthase [Spongiactinospora gelatinilytica]PZG51996.1 glucosyl-3-phosphoglycerate synthase [Spongiactinospora gelatinilytica]
MDAYAKVRRWARRRTSRATDWPLDRLVAAKGTRGVSVILPAKDEAATVGGIVSAIRTGLPALVDEILVVDSRSADATARVAAEAGARVVHQDAVLPHLPALPGKGDALWKGLAAAGGDFVVFVDADLRNFGPHFVSGLLGPLLTTEEIGFVKALYERPHITEDGVTHPGEGGRVTELVARPLLNLYWPELSGFVQPLGGEYAGRRDVLERVPFVSGYGVELGLLIDLLGIIGLDGMAQVDLGDRVHAHQSTAALGRMAGQILLTAWSRLDRQGRIVSSEPLNPYLLQYERGRPRVSDVSVAERPPLASVARQKAGRQG